MYKVRGIRQDHPLVINGIPPWIWPILAAPFIGSFLGVLALRLPAGRSVIWGRSSCPHCRHTLGPAELVPVMSWLLARRRCRHCHAPVTPFYAAIEIGALVPAIWAAQVLPADQLLASCVLGWSLLALAVIDARSFLLPDAITLPLIPLGLVVAYLDDPSTLLPHAAGAAIGFAAFALIGAGYRRLRHREGLGGGDAKLLAAAGAWLSWEGLPSVVLIAAMASFAGLLLDRRIDRRRLLDTRLPFGPGLCLGTWLVWLYGPLS